MNPSTIRSKRPPARQENFHENPPPPAQTDPSSSGRNQNCRFTSGNAGGPGNPFARQVAQFRSALIQRVTVQDMNEIADALIMKARAGHLPAIKLLFQYVIGKPGQAGNPDTLDLDEFQRIYAPRQAVMEQFPKLMHNVPPEMLTTPLRALNDVAGAQLKKLLQLPYEQFQALANNPAGLAASLAASLPGEASEVTSALSGDEHESALEDDELQDPDELQEDGQETDAPSTNGGHDHQGPRVSAADVPDKSHRKNAQVSIRPPSSSRKLAFVPSPNGKSPIRSARMPPTTNGQRKSPGPMRTKERRRGRNRAAPDQRKLDKR